MEFRRILLFVRQRGLLVLLIACVSAGASYYYSRQLTPIYNATTTVLVNQTQAQGVIQYNDVLTSERLTSTYAELAKSRPILSEVVTRLGLPWTASQLAENISVLPVRNTQLLRITVEDPDPGQAAYIANTIARVFIEDNGRQLGNRPGSVSIAEEANVPSAPAKPNVVRNVVLATILGLLAAVGLGLLLDYLDDTVKSADDIEAAGLVSLGAIPRFQGPVRGKDKEASPLRAQSREDLRQLRTSIHFSMASPISKTLLVTSANPGEGKTTTAANLAIVLAQAGHEVILVDADLRRPSLHNHFGSANSFGLTGLILSHNENPEPALIKTEVPCLRLLPSGPVPPNPSEILMSAQIRKILLALRARADYVIVDSSPLLAVTDARLLSSAVDATILVVEEGRTRSKSFQMAAQLLPQANAKVIGVVLNKSHSRRRSYHYSYGYAADLEQDGGGEAVPRSMRSA